MFNFDSGIAKRNGPLAKVWLASHMGERKLSKAQLLGVSIPRSVGAIFGSDELPFALRLSGQLLLGVARIYSRKAKYLVDDCNDALTKLKMTFRPGATAAVDMTAEQAQASRAAITRQDQTNEFDALYMDIEMDLWEPPVYQPKATPGKSVAIAREEDITRQEDDDDDDFRMPQIEFGDDFFGYRVGRDVELQSMREGSIASKRARTEELGDMSVEMGRDAVHSSGRLSNRMSNGLESEHDQFFMDDMGGGGGHDGYGMELDFDPLPAPFADRTLSSQGDFDLTAILDAHDEGLARQKTPATDIMEGQADGQRTPRATSPAASQVNGDAQIDVTPRTAKRVADTAAQNSAKKRRAISKPKVGKQIVDATTELAGLQGGRRGAQSQGGLRATDPSLLVAPRYLPASREALRFFEINQDPVAYFLPRVLPNGNLYIGPPELVPELAKLFEIPNTKTKSPAKRKRTAEPSEPDMSVEIGRRAGTQPPSDRFSLGDGTLRFEDDWDPNAFGDTGGGGDDMFQPDYADLSLQSRGKSSTPAPPASRGLTPLSADLFMTPIKNREPGEGMLGEFHVIPQSEASQRTQSQFDERLAASSGWSKNTVKALQVLNNELGPPPVAGEEVEDKVLSFKEASKEATRTAAASFFFEMLVLGSRGCVDLNQKAPYEDISVTAKPKMWNVVGRENMAPRSSSAAPETSPSRTPIAGR